MYKCHSCSYCTAIKETRPYGMCSFFPSGDKIVNIVFDTCPNHSKEREEERLLEEEYYKSKRKRR